MNSKPLSSKLPINRPCLDFQVPSNLSIVTAVTSNLSDESILENEINSNYFDIFRDILKNKREAKELRKIHEEMFETYVSSLDYVDMKTAKGYCRIISKFLLFSPSVDPDELDPFLTREFKLEQKSASLIQNLKGTSLNYYRCINAFLKSVYSTGYSSLSPDYASSLKIGFKNKEAFASLSDVLNAYYELTKIGKHEDALILHLTYSLGVNLETLSLFTYDSIDDDNSIKYFDTLKMEYVDAKLNEHLIRDISHFKEITRNFTQETRNGYKCFKDKAVVMGDFMFDWTPSTIYNRFASCFGGKLSWFKYTPDKIVQLSKMMKSMDNHRDDNESLDLFDDSIQMMKENKG